MVLNHSGYYFSQSQDVVKELTEMFVGSKKDQNDKSVAHQEAEMLSESSQRRQRRSPTDMEVSQKAAGEPLGCVYIQKCL